MYSVVPHEGTWIEIKMSNDYCMKQLVVPHEGTWIEIGDKIQSYGSV